jgi:hypothetical protein
MKKGVPNVHLIWLMATVFVAFPGFSQKFSVDRPEEVIKPDPYTAMYFDDKNNYSKVATMITITKDRSRNFRGDTLYIDHYSQGLKVKTIRFESGKRSTTTEYTYQANRNLLMWKTYERNAFAFTKYTYNKAGQLAETHQYYVTTKGQKIDTTEKSRMLFKYEGPKLVQIKNNALGMDVVEEYQYKNGLLHVKSGGFVSKLFRYSTDRRVTGIEDHMGGSIDSVKIMGRERFAYYPDGKIKVDSVLTSMNIPTNSYMVTEYEYDDKGRLRIMKTKHKDAYRDVQFTYDGVRLKRVHLATNSNTGALRFLISHRIDEYYKYPITYREEFTYDAKGNRVSKKMFVNDEVWGEVEYLFEYAGK